MCPGQRHRCCCRDLAQSSPISPGDCWSSCCLLDNLPREFYQWKTNPQYSVCQFRSLKWLSTRIHVQRNCGRGQQQRGEARISIFFPSRATAPGSDPLPPPLPPPAAQSLMPEELFWSPLGVLHSSLLAGMAQRVLTHVPSAEIPSPKFTSPGSFLLFLLFGYLAVGLSSSLCQEYKHSRRQHPGWYQGSEIIVAL